MVIKRGRRMSNDLISRNWSIVENFKGIYNIDVRQLCS